MTAVDTESLSREFALRCDSEGVVRWIDSRAARLFRLEPGKPMRAAAARGSEEKVDRFLAEPPEHAPVEVLLCVDDQPRMATLLGRRDAQGNVTVVGSMVSDAYSDAMTRLGESMSEMATLHREADRRERELLRRHEELVRLHRDLEESFKGVVALHAEIGEKDDSLRRAGEVKARLVANVSHEFRTPLNSILGLTQLLLSRSDGDLTEEQETQLKFIKQSTESLYTLVNDLLDLSKMEAGKVALRAEVFTVGALFAALRGMLRPLTAGSKVKLVVEEAEGVPDLETDEGKIAQILRNLISNALKFTTEGEVRVSAETGPGGMVVFRVRDTGIGIAPENLDRVFEEFFQIDSPLQRNVKGTGLGLSLSRHIAGQLGGTLEVASELGRGSTFTLTVPARHPEVSAMVALTERGRHPDADHQPILVVEDDRQTLFLYEKYLRGSGFHVIPARSIEEAREAIRRVRPAAVVLDIMLDGETSWSFLQELKTEEATRDIPTLVVTVTNREDKARALGADEFFMKPMDREWLLMKLRQLAHQQPVETILVIDDDQVARYLVRKHLTGLPYEVIEAASGPEGLRLARDRLPHVIFLDFVMPDMSAFDVLDELKKDPATRRIPVIIHTSKNLAEEERRRLEAEATTILSKQSLSREIAIARIREALEKAGIRSSRNNGERHG